MYRNSSLKPPKRPEGEKYQKREMVKGLVTVTPGWVLHSAKKRHLANVAEFNPAHVIDEERDEKKKKRTKKVSLKSPVKQESRKRQMKKVQLQMTTPPAPPTPNPTVSTVTPVTSVMVATTTSTTTASNQLCLKVKHFWPLYLKKTFDLQIFK